MFKIEVLINTNYIEAFFFFFFFLPDSIFSNIWIIFGLKIVEINTINTLKTKIKSRVNNIWLKLNHFSFIYLEIEDCIQMLITKATSCINYFQRKSIHSHNTLKYLQKKLKLTKSRYFIFFFNKLSLINLNNNDE